MKIIFIGDQGLKRAKTAEDLFAKRFETKSGGLFSDQPISKEELEWADLIVVMEDFQRRTIANRFPEVYGKKQLISLEIQDKYEYNDPELIKILENKLNQIVEPIVH